MKVEVQEISPVEKRVDIELPAEQVDDEIKEKFDEVGRTVQVKGFRPGKAPRKVVERLFKDHINELVMKSLVEGSMEAALDRKAIEPVAQPVIDPGEVKPGEPYAYTVHVEVKPKIELEEYKGLELVHKNMEIGDDEVEKTLEDLRERVAVIQPLETERPIKADDMVAATIKVMEGGEEIEFGGGDEQEIELWRESWVPGLVDNLVGKSEGDEGAFTEDVPDNPNVPELYRGKTLTFTFNVTGVKERVLAELDDDFAKENSRFETLDELKESIRESLGEQADRANRNHLEQAALDAIIEKNPIEVPPTPAKNEALQMAVDFMAKNTGKRPTNEEAEQFSDMFLEEARKSFKAIYILEAVAEAEGIEADDDEVEERLKKDAERMGVAPDKLKGRLGDEGMEAMKQRAALDKALDFLIGAATIEDEAKKTEDNYD